MASHANLEDSLVGVRAFEHPSVHSYWDWLIREYKPSSWLALVTPCSRIKPYTKSPSSRKVRAILRGMGLWGDGKPQGLDWLFFSDLLILVPYEKAEDYPACCYDVPPDLVLNVDELREAVTSTLAKAVERLVALGVEKSVVFLPKKHLQLWDRAKLKARAWPSEVRVPYTIYSFKALEDALREALASRLRQ